MGDVIFLPRPRPRLVVDNGARRPTGPAIPAPDARSRDRLFPLAVATAGLLGAALGWWHGWASVGVLAPIATALWCAGIVAIALGYGATADQGEAVARRRDWRP
ncbi:hypothetical protein [Xanthobacter flavus]|uniref:hypothetical protein n=1 Tax=Xanthobacter flavus TaxID=281 RepID=UPI003728BFF6